MVDEEARSNALLALAATLTHSQDARGEKIFSQAIEASLLISDARKRIEA